MMRAYSSAVLCFAFGASAGIAGCGDDDGGKDPCDGVEGTCFAVASGATVSEAQRVLINATSGSTVAFGEGTFEFKTGLSLDVDDVRIIGQGMDKTILSFKGQADGAQGLLVTANDFTLEDIAVVETAGDGVKIEGANRVVIRRTRVEWAALENENNGAYGLYPVQCKNVLIEDSYVSGASDAGIYVGQSENIVVRRNRAENNVAGIEIENCKKADVYDNIATKNTGGILVFNLPGLPVGNGEQTRVYMNEIYENNTKNFAPAGNIVGQVPKGTGVVVLAAQKVEIFDNDIRDNKTNNIGIISYPLLDIPFTDPNYDPFSVGVHIHDNRISGPSNAPDSTLQLALLLVVSMTEANINTGGVIPDVAWDGIMDPRRVVGGEYGAADKLCVRANGDADFINLQAPPGVAPVASVDAAAFACTHAPLPAVTLEGIQ
jgi:parallel beta-helix repeat protein